MDSNCESGEYIIDNLSMPMSDTRRMIATVVVAVFGFALFGMVHTAHAAAPYLRSTLITGITFDQSTLQKAAPGSDMFGYTTASDGNIYVGWGDGGGFGGTNSIGRASLGIGRITGIPPAWKGVNLWGGANPLSAQPAIEGKPSNSIIAVNGAIYVYVAEQDVWSNNTLWKSTDLGLTWMKIGVLFNEPGSAFNNPAIIQFGSNYQGARDNYIYGYTNKFSLAGKGSLALFRVDKAKLESRANYEFVIGYNGSGDPLWGTDVSKAKPVFTDPQGVNWGTTVTYLPTLKRYLLSVRHSSDDSGEWGLFEAPEPWGPWATIAYGNELPSWLWSQDPDGASPNRPAYMHNFPQKWMSSDGKVVWQISDRGDQFNLVKATFSIAADTSTGTGSTGTTDTTGNDWHY